MGLSLGVYAQQYQPDKSYLSFGVGVGNYADRDGIPLWVHYEYGFSDWFSAGGMLAHQRWEYRYTNVGKYRYTATFFALRGSAHFAKALNIKEIDLYAGLGLGYIRYTDEWVSSNNNQVRPLGTSFSSNFLGIHAGVRYFFNKANTVGVLGEVGYGLSPLLVGLTFKF